MPRTLTLNVHPDGIVEIDANGFVGKACEEATQKYLEAMRAEVQSTVCKMEYDTQATEGLTEGEIGG